MTQNSPNDYRLTAVPSEVHADKARLLFRGETLADGKLGLSAAMAVCEVVEKTWLPGHLSSIPTLPAHEREDIANAQATLVTGVDGKFDVMVLGRRTICGMKRPAGDFLVDILNNSLLVAGRKAARDEQERRTIDIRSDAETSSNLPALSSPISAPATAPAPTALRDSGERRVAVRTALSSTGADIVGRDDERPLCDPASSPSFLHNFAGLTEVAVKSLNETLNQEAVRRTRAADDEPDAHPFLTRSEMLDVVDLVSARIMHGLDLDNPVAAMSVLMSEPALTDRWVRFGLRYGGSASLGAVVVDAVQDAVRDVLIREVEGIFEDEVLALTEGDIAASLSATMAWLEEYARTSDVADNALVALDGALRRAQGHSTDALATAILQAAEALREAGNDAIARQLVALGEKTAARARSVPLLPR